MPSGHHNPNFMAVNGYSKEANPVYVGKYQLSKGLISRIGNHRPYMPKDVPEANADVKIMSEYFYHSQDPLRPQVLSSFIISSYTVCIKNCCFDTVALIIYVIFYTIFYITWLFRLLDVGYFNKTFYIVPT